MIQIEKKKRVWIKRSECFSRHCGACGTQMITACMSKSESRFASEEDSERRTIFFKRFPYAQLPADMLVFFFALLQ